MRILHRFSALLVLSAVVVMSACGPLAPCSSEVGTIRGTWAISTINGQAIPGGGFQLPSTTDRLTIGTLYFEPQVAQCDGSSMYSEEGTVVAEYTLVTAAGVGKPSRTYAGTFKHTLAMDIVTISADGNSAFGREPVTYGPITFEGTLPSLGGLTVVFRRLQ